MMNHSSDLNRVRPPRISFGIAGGLLLTAAEVSAEPWIDFSHYGFSGLREVMNVHPVFVHFPIALFPLTLLFLCLGTWFKSLSFFFAGRVLLWLTLVSLAVTVATGLMADDIPHTPEIHGMLVTHQNTAFVILGLTLVICVWSLLRRRTPVDDTVLRLPIGNAWFLIAVAVTTVLVLQNGDIGSRMVYLHGAAVKPMSGQMEGVHEDESGEHGIHEHSHDHSHDAEPR